MMPDTYDFVIAGGGSNTLTAAAYLAAGGNSVIVLEKNKFVGGGCVTLEVTLPGFKHDLHATNIFLVKANPLIKNDELGLLSKFGLEYVTTENAYHGSLFDDGKVIEVYTSLDRTCASIAEICVADSKAYRSLVGKAQPLVNILSWGMFAPPADPATFVEILKQSPEGNYMLDLMQASAWSLINETFEDPHVKTHLYRKTSEMMVSPEEPGSAFAMFIILGFTHRLTSGFLVGGSQTFSDSLARCIEYHGGKVLTGKEVVKLDVVNGIINSAETKDGQRYYARRAVIAGIPPWDLHKVINGFDSGLTEIARRARPSDFGVFLSSYALKENVKPVHGERYGAIQINQCCLCNVDIIRKTYSDILSGKLPEHYFANFCCATIHDPTRAPNGHGTLFLYHMVPMIPKEGTLDTWDELKEGFADWMLQGSKKYIENMDESNILGAYHTSPKDMSLHTPSFRNGDVMGCGTFSDQFTNGRPVKEFADFKVPGIDGLYLCGPFMHPGGGVAGGGRAVAMKVMFDLGMDLDKAFTYY